MPPQLPARADVVVVGAGHNGLVAAALLARAGLQVTVLERDQVIGGAARTEAPFAKVPGLRQSTGSYLLGLMPPELMALLGLDLPVLRRDPHYFLPTLEGRYLQFGTQRTPLASEQDERADAALQAEIGALRDDIAPAWLTEPLTVEETADRYVRPELRATFVGLCRGSVASYLDRFGFADPLMPAMYAVTDGLSGLTAGPDTPGSGHNFLVHNMCRLPGADGTWMIVRGGMGTVSGAIADVARAHGASIHADTPVDEVVVEGGAVAGVRVGDHEVRAPVVLGACDPWRLAEITGADVLPTDLTERLERIARDGTTMKVNLALSGLPTFSCLPAGAPSPFGSTIHLLPGGMDEVRSMWRDVQAGRLPDFPTIEWYLHTTVDPSLQDDAGHHSSALFVQSVPYELAGTTWEAELDGYVEHLLSICDRFAPGTSDLVDDTLPLTPQGIEAHFGISRGHIHHVDNGVAFADRMPYVTGVPGLYAGSAGCHPAGSVIGAAGHNAAQRILADLGRPAAR